MKPRIQLLYFEGCPNVEKARQNLKIALSRAGLAATWEEIDIRAENAPNKWRGFSSPTVLINGRDIATGAAEAEGSGACRFGGAPGIDLIAERLGRPSGSWPAAAGALPALAAGFLPVGFCPACYPAWAGLLGALGLGAYGDKLLAPLTALLLLAALGGLAFQGRRSGNYRPLLFGTAGAALMYAGQFMVGSAALRWFGIVLLVGASFWNVIPRLKGGKSCPACSENGGD
ncbi:MAG TPA: MerC family mercury resistance protein [Elusimicrobiota bacterium]|nr:MerC family mercury resistance protein [Elusimicrobiota bacterium]